MVLTVVEGLTDEVFFNKVKLLRDLPLELRSHSNGGQSQIPNMVRTFLRTGVTRLAVAQDINSDPPSRVVQSVQSMVANALSGPIENLTPSGEKFQVGNVIVGVVPVGLPDDPDLSELGITSHSMEDFLVKLLLRDQSLTRNVDDFKQLLLDLTQRIREQGLPFQSCKEVFQLAKPIIQHSFSDTGVVNSLFENADPEAVQEVMAPLLDKIEQVLPP